MMDRCVPAIAFLCCVAALLACKRNDSSPAPSATAASAAAQPAAVAANEVTFTAKVPKAGRTSTIARDLSLSLTMGGKVYRQTEHRRYKVTVKAADDIRVTRALLDIEEMFETEQEGTRTEKKTVSPLAGFKFIASRDDAKKLTAVDPDGAPVSKSLVKALDKDYADTFEKNTLGAFLPNRALKLGEKLNPSESDVMKTLGIKDDGKTSLDGIEFILKSAQAGNATFQIALTWTSKLSAVRRMRAKLAGQLTLQTATVWLVAFELQGPVTVLDSKGKEQGKGTMKFKVDQAFN
jgi:hypothetical protein